MIKSYFKTCKNKNVIAKIEGRKNYLKSLFLYKLISFISAINVTNDLSDLGKNIKIC